MSISAAVTNGDTNALVDEINKILGYGIRFRLDWSVILQKDDGNDIAITNVTTLNPTSGPYSR